MTPEPSIEPPDQIGLGECPSREPWLASVVANSGDLFAVTTETGEVVVVAGPTVSVLGVEAESLIGANLFDLVQPADLERARALWAQRVTTFDPMPGDDFWTTRADGRKVCLNLLVNNLLDDPTVRGIVVTARDVTTRRRLDEVRLLLSEIGSFHSRASGAGEYLDRVCELVVSRPLFSNVCVLAREGPGWEIQSWSSANGTPPDVWLAALEGHRLGHQAGLLGADDLPIVIQDIAPMEVGQVPVRSLALLSTEIEGRDAVLAVGSAEPYVFIDDVLTVLGEVAWNINLGSRTLQAEIERAQQLRRLTESLKAAVTSIATACELRDPYTAGHQRRVAVLAAEIARRLGMDDDEIVGVGLAATIHDIGKLAVPAEILTRPGRLTEHEMAIVRQHCRNGYEIVSPIEFPWPVAEMILQHHERMNGSGYPDRLTGEQILVGARIIGVADVVDAMTGHRPYRPARGLGEALAELTTNRTTLYDERVVDACLQLFSEGFRLDD